MELIFLIAVVALAAWKLRRPGGAIDPASLVGPVASSPTTEWGVVVPLARAETKRVLFHPAFIVGVLLTPIIVLAAVSGATTWREVSGGLALGLVPLGWMTIIAANLVAQRSRRAGTEELLAALPAPQSARTSALLATVVGPAMVATLFGIASMVLLGTGSRAFSGSPEPLETAAGLLIVAGAVAVGVAVARWLPGGGWGIAAVIVVIFLQARFLDVNTWPWNRPQGDPMRFLGFLAEPTHAGLNYLEPRPAGWHLVYLAGLSTLMGGVALAREGLRRNLRVLIGGALAVVVVAGWIQTRPLTATQEAARASFLLEPAEHQVCEESDGVTYCAYRDFVDDLPGWRERVGATLAVLPAEAREGRRPLEVRQRPASVIGDSDCSPEKYLRTLTAGIASRIDVDALWPADGNVHPSFGTEAFPCSDQAVDNFFLAVQTGAWAVGLPPAPHGDNVRCVATGQARSAIALWAAASATPNGEGTLREVIAGGALGEALIDFTDWDSPPMWGVDYAADDARLALEILSVSTDEVRTALALDWEHWIDATTTTETLAAELGLDRPTVDVGPSSRDLPVTSSAIFAGLRVTRWHPLAIAMVGGALYALLGSKVTAPDRLMVAAAAVAATSAFVIDDPAAVTVASMPPPLLVRRASRVVLATIPVAAWWVVVVTIAVARFGSLPIRSISLALVGLAAIALAVGSVAAGSGLAERDGLAGATASAVFFGLTLLPLPSWSPLPRSPGTPGTEARWLVIAGISLVIFGWSARDPAGGRSR